VPARELAALPRLPRWIGGAGKGIKKMYRKRKSDAPHLI